MRTSTERKDNYEQLQAEEARKEAAARHKSFELLAKPMYSYANMLGETFHNLHFEESGKARLAMISGWLVGLQQCGKAEMARELAHDLVGSLEYLNGYGGNTDVTPDDICQKHWIESGQGERKLEMPTWRVVLADDGTMHGFRLGWHRLTSADVVKKKAQELMDSRLPLRSVDGTELKYGTDEYWSKNDACWKQCQRDVQKEMGIYEKLRQHRPYWSTDDPDRRWGASYVHGEYGYSHNGGLLYHGPGGGETFAVTLGDCKAWSIHT